jgi:predicted hotdog family 3-hydroxylacyl-ACP dehydratase
MIVPVHEQPIPTPAPRLEGEGRFEALARLNVMAQAMLDRRAA